MRPTADKRAERKQDMPFFPAIATAFAAAVFMASCLLLFGCTAMAGQTANSLLPQNISNATNGTQGFGQNGTAANNSTQPHNSCTTVQLRTCPDGSPSYSVQCTSGYSRTFACPDNPYNKNLSKIPDSMLYLAKFKCYWDLRQGTSYGPLYDPSAVCRMQGPGWEDACDCANSIDAYVSQYGMPN